jgi:hypothetical protein
MTKPKKGFNQKTFDLTFNGATLMPVVQSRWKTGNCGTRACPRTQMARRPMTG